MKIRIYSLKTKIAVLTLLVVVLALLLSGLSIYAYMYGIFSNTIINDNTAILSSLNQRLAYTADSTQQYAKNIIIDDVIQNSLRMRESLSPLDYDYYSNIRKIDDRLSEYLTMRDNMIDDIYIVDPGFEVVTNKGIRDSSIKEWSTSFIERGALSGFTGRHISSARSVDKSAEVISYVTVINDKIRSGARLGYLVIDLKNTSMTNILQTSLGSMNQLYVFGQDGLLFSNNGSSENADSTQSLLTQLTHFREGVNLNDNQYAITQSISGTDWKMTGFISKSFITQHILQIGLRFSLILTVCLIPLILIILPIANNVTKPINVLIRAMKEVSMGKLKEEIDIQSRDEIELLANGFNYMVRAIRKNMEDLISKQKKERELELQLLMKQLNPHFIYNTLNCIIYLARRIEATEIIELTKSFIMLLQQTAKMLPDERVTLTEELYYIQTYIDILKYRYEDKVHYTIDIDPSLNDLKIPKLLLYPLVENSIFHGLLPRSDVGNLTVSAKHLDNSVEISVTDNGVGFSPLYTSETQNWMTKDFSDAIEHIGLRNVYQRLMIHYGQSSALSIESVPYVRTRISFRLPL